MVMLLFDQNVHLLIDNVEGENAEGVVHLNRARGTVLVETALGHLHTNIHTSQLTFQREGEIC